MPDRIIHKVDFEPVVQIEEKVLLITNTGKIPAKVIYIEPIPWIEIDFGALTAGSQSSERELEELYVEDNEFAQYRYAVLSSNLKVVSHKCPAAAPYYSTKKGVYIEVPDISTYGTYEPTKNLQLTEFYQYKDTTRTMVVQNTGTTDLSESKVAFFGYVFVFEVLDKIEKPYTAIPCVARSSIGGRSR